MKKILCEELQVRLRLILLNFEKFYPSEYFIDLCDVFVHESGCVIIYCLGTEFTW